MSKKRKTMDVTHTGAGGPVRVPVDESERGYVNEAEYAAGIVARREYGRNGMAGPVRPESWSGDYKSYTYDVFIGKDCGDGYMQGRNIWVYVDFPDDDGEE